jgi:hypothetical protein
MPYDNTFHFGSSNIQNNVAVQMPSSTRATDLLITQPTTPDVGLLARVAFVAKRLATIPCRFASEGQTIFIHRAQFQHTFPSSLQDAMSACALYSMKTEANQALVFSHVEHKCRQLIASTNAQLASRTELLAALQALLLYQMIRLFDGDIRLRVNAEVDEPTTLQWASQLKASMRDNAVHQGTTHLARCSTRSSRIGTSIDSSDDWHTWLTAESTRRTTIITTYLLQGIYSFLKLG